MGIIKSILNKLNPAQRYISDEAGTRVGSNQNKINTVENAYNLMEVTNRCINILVDSSAEVEYDIKDRLSFIPRIPGMRQVTLTTLLNHRPNPWMDISTFRRLLLIDFLMDGNCFIYYDGSSFYHLPAKDVDVLTDDKNGVAGYEFAGTIPFGTQEIIHIRDNASSSSYRQFRGRSRINSALRSILTHETAVQFQENYFNNGAVVGLIIETEALLNTKLKERKEREWQAKYNPKDGGAKPMILDGGMKAKTLTQSSFRDMDFNDSLEVIESRVCKALGVPPILLDSGNNANIRPNIELMFSLTIIPMMRKFESALEHAFGYDVKLTTYDIMALKPDLKQEAERVSTLVNNGLATGNEGRAMLRMEPINDPLMEDIRIPANIAGSATNVTGQEGGKPTQEE